MKGTVILCSILTAASWTAASSDSDNHEVITSRSRDLHQLPTLVKRTGGKPPGPRRAGSSKSDQGPSRPTFPKPPGSVKSDSAFTKPPGFTSPRKDAVYTKPRTQSESGSSAFNSAIGRTGSMSSLLNTKTSWQSAKGRSGSPPSHSVERTGSFSSARGRPESVSDLSRTESLQSATGRSTTSSALQRTLSLGSAVGVPDSPAAIHKTSSSFASAVGRSGPQAGIHATSSSFASAMGRPESPAAIQRTSSSLVSAVGRPDSPPRIQRTGSYESAKGAAAPATGPPTVKSGNSSPQNSPPSSPRNSPPPSPVRASSMKSGKSSPPSSGQASPTGQITHSPGTPTNEQGTSPKSGSRSQSELSFAPPRAASVGNQSPKASESRASINNGPSRANSIDSNRSSTFSIPLSTWHSSMADSRGPSRANSQELANANTNTESRGSSRGSSKANSLSIWGTNRANSPTSHGQLSGLPGPNSRPSSPRGLVRQGSASSSTSYSSSEKSDAPPFTEDDYRRHGPQSWAGTNSPARSKVGSSLHSGPHSLSPTGAQSLLGSVASDRTQPIRPLTRTQSPVNGQAGGASNTNASNRGSQPETGSASNRRTPDFSSKSSGLVSSAPPGANFDPNAKTWNGGAKMGAANVRASVGNVDANHISTPGKGQSAVPAKAQPQTNLASWLAPQPGVPSRFSSPPRTPRMPTSEITPDPSTPPQTTQQRPGESRGSTVDATPIQAAGRLAQPGTSSPGSPSATSQGANDGRSKSPLFPVGGGTYVPNGKGNKGPPVLPVSTPAGGIANSQSPSTSPIRSSPQPPKKEPLQNPSIVVHGRHGDTMHMSVPPGRIAQVRVPNPIGTNKNAKGQIVYGTLADGGKSMGPAIAHQNNPGGFVASCAYTAAGCLGVVSGAYGAASGRAGAGYEMAAGASLAVGGGMGMMNAFGLDKALVDGVKGVGGSIKNCVGAACGRMKNSNTGGAAQPSQQAASQPASGQPASNTGASRYAASVDSLPVRRR